MTDATPNGIADAPKIDCATDDASTFQVQDAGQDAPNDQCTTDEETTKDKIKMILNEIDPNPGSEYMEQLQRGNVRPHPRRTVRTTLSERQWIG